MGEYSIRRLHRWRNWPEISFVIATLCITRGEANSSAAVFPSYGPQITNNSTAVNASTCDDWWENAGRSSLEDYPVTQRIVMTVQILVALVTVAGNLLVLIALCTFNELQTITNMFVASLAIADLIMGAFVMPLGIPYVAHGRWGLGSLFCDIWISIDVLVVTASIETLCAIALDRYLAITKPFSYTANVTRSRARCLIAFIWITAASIAFVPVQLGWWKVDFYEAECCYKTAACCEFMTNQTYAIVSSAVSFYIPTALMIFSYSIVFKEAIRLASQIDDQSGVIRRASMPGARHRPLWNKEQRRTVFTFGYIMGIFTICWLPFFIVNPAQALGAGIPSAIFTSLNWMGYANSFFNPFIYSHNAQFRQAFLRLLTCMPCSEGFQRTKRASLSESFPRYRSSSRDSTFHTISSFFLSGGSSKKRSNSSRKSTMSMGGKRDSTVSGGRSPSRSPSAHARFQIGSEDNDLSTQLSRTDNNNDSDNDVFKRDTDSNGVLSVLSEKSADGTTRSVTFVDNGFHHSITRCSEFGENKSSVVEKLLSIGKRNIVDETSSSALHLSRGDSFSEQNESSAMLPDGKMEACRHYVNGVHRIRTRRTKSLYVKSLDGIYVRNCSSLFGPKSNSSDLIELNTEEDTSSNMSEPIISVTETELANSRSQENLPNRD